MELAATSDGIAALDVFKRQLDKSTKDKPISDYWPGWLNAASISRDNISSKAGSWGGNDKGRLWVSPGR